MLQDTTNEHDLDLDQSVTYTRINWPHLSYDVLHKLSVRKLCGQDTSYNEQEISNELNNFFPNVITSIITKCLNMELSLVMFISSPSVENKDRGYNVFDVIITKPTTYEFVGMSFLHISNKIKQCSIVRAIHHPNMVTELCRSETLFENSDLSILNKEYIKKITNKQYITHSIEKFACIRTYNRQTKSKVDGHEVSCSKKEMDESESLVQDVYDILSTYYLLLEYIVSFDYDSIIVNEK